MARSAKYTLRFSAMAQTTLAALLLFACRPASAELGVTEREIRLGAVTAKTGPIASSGLSVLFGLDLYFNRINRTGGINGRRVTLLTDDDGYEPTKTIAATQKMLDGEKVFALIGFNGSPTTKAIVPIVERHKVPLLFPRTGESAVRDRQNKFIVNYRATFADELSVLIEEMMVKRKLKRVAVLAQSDGLGDGIRAGTQKALSEKGLPKMVVEAKVDRNSPDVAAGFKTIEAATPDAVVIGAASGSAVPFVKMALEKHPDWLYATVSNNISVVYKVKETKAAYLATQSVPEPESSALQIAADFRADWKAAKKDPTIDEMIAFEAYLNAALFADAAKSCGQELTRNKLMSAFEGKSFDIGGFKVAFFPGTHNAAAPIYLSELKDGKFIYSKEPSVTTNSATP